MGDGEGTQYLSFPGSGTPKQKSRRPRPAVPNPAAQTYHWDSSSPRFLRQSCRKRMPCHGSDLGLKPDQKTQIQCWGANWSESTESPWRFNGDTPNSLHIPPLPARCSWNLSAQVSLKSHPPLLSHGCSGPASCTEGWGRVHRGEPGSCSIPSPLSTQETGRPACLETPAYT